MKGDGFGAHSGQALKEVRRQLREHWVFVSTFRRTALDYANGASIAYEYDTASRLLEIDNQTNSGYHDYDAVGNRTTVVDGDGDAAGRGDGRGGRSRGG